MKNVARKVFRVQNEGDRLNKACARGVVGFLDVIGGDVLELFLGVL